jgi:hypothetical protein
LKVRLEDSKTQYNKKRIALTGDYNEYNARVNNFNANNEYWRRNGGISEKSYTEIKKEKEKLDSNYHYLSKNI